MFLVKLGKKSFKCNILLDRTLSTVFIESKFVLLVLFFLFSSCSTLNLTLPISDLESPQHQGRKTGWGVDFAGVTSKQLTLTEDPSKRPLDVTAGKHTTANLFLTKSGLNYYFLERGMVAVTLIDSKIPSAKLKFSFLTGYREDAQPGVFYGSIHLMGSYQMAESTGNQNGVGGPVGFPWKGKANMISGTAGISFGYQAFKKVTPFIGANFQQFQTSGEVTHTATSTDAGATYNIKVADGKVLTYGFGLDIRPNPRFYLTPQIYMYNFKWYENDFNEIGGSVKLIYVPVQ